jgi:transcriptional regulator with XRE-family HTH domain
MIFTELIMTINERILEARKKLGLSQIKFAQGIKISNGYQASIELNNRKVNDRIIQLISTNFGISEEWLKTGQGDMLGHYDDFELEQIINVYKRLDPDFRHYLLKQLDILLALQETKDRKTTEKN